MRRPLTLVAVVVLAIGAVVVWKSHVHDAGDTAPACTYATLERISFPGGHVTDHKRKSGAPEVKIDVHMTSRERSFPCSPSESDDACKERVTREFGPLPTPADRLEITIDTSAGRIAFASPSFFGTRHAVAHENQTWVPDQPGASPASGNAFKAEFDGAWVAGVINGPAKDGSYLLDVWCSTKEAALPGVRTTGSNGK